MSKSLEERLKTHSSAFDGLLSLIPAKYYYDEATQHQWKEKKKSKEELRQNKKLKLDPTVVDVQSSSAKDVLKQREKEAQPVVLPGSKITKADVQEEADDDGAASDEDDSDVAEFNASELEDDDGDDAAESSASKDTEDVDLLQNTGELVFDDEGNEIEKQQEAEVEQDGAKGKTKGRKQQLTPEEEKAKAERLVALREKLSSKITALKEKRKAPGTKVAGAPSSRQAILEQRKAKAEQAKKRKAVALSEDEDEDEDESSSDEEEEQNQVLYQNIVFNDGDRVTSDLSALRKVKGKKGPSNNDIKAHLAQLQLQKQKIAEMDPEKKSQFEEKTKWNRLISNIEGVKLKDDEKLLKRALKRKEKQKMKSEREWRERKDTVEATVAARAKRREENLQARKDNKGKRSKKQTKLKKKFTGIVNKRTNGGDAKGKKKRAGFEGRMKSGKKK